MYSYSEDLAGWDFEQPHLVEGVGGDGTRWALKFIPTQTIPQFCDKWSISRQPGSALKIPDRFSFGERGGGVQELCYLWAWQSSPARLLTPLHSHYRSLCLRPLSYCDLQALANNAHIQVQCIRFNTKWLILYTRVMAQDSRGQFAQLNVLRNRVHFLAALIRLLWVRDMVNIKV